MKYMVFTAVMIYQDVMPFTPVEVFCSFGEIYWLQFSGTKYNPRLRREGRLCLIGLCFDRLMPDYKSISKHEYSAVSPVSGCRLADRARGSLGR
jgi:hypothetical protein